jgi:putative toxin-antitoxin system antitoxin component (TIGR02293 family)
MADAVAKGLPEKALERVKQSLGLTDAEMASTLGMSPKTIGRLRSGRSRLPAVTSDRLYRLARIYSLAKDVFEADDAAREWLRRPQTGLGNRVPLELMTTEVGAREVEDLLGRIEYGVLA